MASPPQTRQPKAYWFPRGGAAYPARRSLAHDSLGARLLGLYGIGNRIKEQRGAFRHGRYSKQATLSRNVRLKSQAAVGLVACLVSASEADSGHRVLTARVSPPDRSPSFRRVANRRHEWLKRVMPGRVSPLGPAEIKPWASPPCPASWSASSPPRTHAPAAARACRPAPAGVRRSGLG